MIKLKNLNMTFTEKDFKKLEALKAYLIDSKAVDYTWEELFIKIAEDYLA